MYILSLENLTRDEGIAVGSLWVFGDKRDEQRIKHFYNKLTHTDAKIQFECVFQFGYTYMILDDQE